ncbi:MAG: hypothetical protein ACJAYF_002353 [Arenicella sp.]|jgi:hypothetical protein
MQGIIKFTLFYGALSTSTIALAHSGHAAGDHSHSGELIAAALAVIVVFALAARKRLLPKRKPLKSDNG